MRASDKKLHAALVYIGMADLAKRAADGEWNDYFGLHAMNIHHLVTTLQSRIDDFPSKRDGILEIIERAKNGDFDGTKAEADEWAASTEGQSVFAELLGDKVN